jgi:hypothetical protein
VLELDLSVGQEFTMRYFYRLVIVLIGVLALAILVTYLSSIFWVHVNPVNAFFSNPDGTSCKHPCLLGVRPGETSYEEALALLRSHPLTHDYHVDFRHGVLHGPEANVILHFEPGHPISLIEYVRITDRSHLVWDTLGSVIADLSAPDQTSVNSDFTISFYLLDHAVFHYSHSVVDHITVDDRLERVAVYAVLPRIPDGAGPWLGFNAAQAYLPDARSIHFRTRVRFDLSPECSPREICRTSQ